MSHITAHDKLLRSAPDDVTSGTSQLTVSYADKRARRPVFADSGVRTALNPATTAIKPQDAVMILLIKHPVKRLFRKVQRKSVRKRSGSADYAWWLSAAAAVAGVAPRGTRRSRPRTSGGAISIRRRITAAWAEAAGQPSARAS